ncbi:helix-turn-helix domain-containing protein [Varibaculum cambriense]|uniref:helix-turn-helix domain-containing protein n=1 Tax=Varibaculum cambriense TaxID=184870 RepID=UPI003CC7E2B2
MAIERQAMRKPIRTTQRGRLLTTEEVAAILGVTPGYVKQLRYTNKGPAFIRLGRAIRYAPGDVTAYARQVRNG